MTSTLKLKESPCGEMYRPQRLQRSDTPRTIRVKQELKKSPYLPALDNMPEFLRYGPWSPTAYIFLIVFVLTMIYQFQSAYDLCPKQINSNTNNTWPGIWRLLLSIYGMGLVAFMCWKFAYWPLLSFTMMSWNLFTVRYLLTSLISFGFIDSYLLYIMSEILRFPSLVCNSITVSIWWLVLFPSINFFIKSKTARNAFIQFNKSPFLINVHLLNLPFAAFDHLTNPRLLNFFDLYMGILVAMIYVLIYLFIMDPMGLHFYHIILSPRPKWCVIPYILSLSLFPLFLWMWNWMVLWLNFV